MKKKLKNLKRRWWKLKISDKIQTIQTLILLLTLMGAIWIGVRQNQINERLKNLQDYVALSIVMSSDEKNTIRLRNIGNINLYSWGLKILDKEIKHDKPRFIGVGGDYFIFLGVDSIKKILDKEEFEFKIYLQDEFGQKWISEHGGKAISSGEDEEGNKKFRFSLWSYKIEKNNWSLEEF